MRRFGSTTRFFVISGVIVAFTLGAASLLTEVQAAGGCICPLIYAPVKCDNGKIYSNQCVATCQHAKNCVPIGPGPVE